MAIVEVGNDVKKKKSVSGKSSAVGIVGIQWLKVHLDRKKNHKTKQ